jgi:hypothetical protein
MVAKLLPGRDQVRARGIVHSDPTKSVCRRVPRF